LWGKRRRRREKRRKRKKKKKKKKKNVNEERGKTRFLLGPDLEKFGHKNLVLPPNFFLVPWRGRDWMENDRLVLLLILQPKKSTNLRLLRKL
jgi:hypothetical protein